MFDLFFNSILFVLGESIRNDDIMENILISLKDEMAGSENDDITFSDEESDTSPKKTITIENNSISSIKTPSKSGIKFFQYNIDVYCNLLKFSINGYFLS